MSTEPLDQIILNSLPSPVVVLDNTGNILAVNGGWHRFTEGRQSLLGKAVFVGSNYLDEWVSVFAANANDAKVCVSGLRRVLSGCLAEFKWEFCRRSLTGEDWFLLHAVPLNREEGGLIVFHNNVTEAKRIEFFTRGKLKQLQMVLDSTAEGIYGINLQGKCIYCNHTALRMLGYRVIDDLIGKNMHDLIHHTRPNGVSYPLQECRIFTAVQQGRCTHVGDEVFWRSDGSSFPTEYWSYPIRREGQVVGAVVTFLDITEQRAAEEQLRQAQKMEAIGQLTGGVAHDFNNLLAIIMGNLELLNEQLVDQAQSADLVKRALTAVERGATLVQRLLAFSRQQSLQVRPVDLNMLVRGVIELLQGTLGKAITIQTLLAPGLWPTLADPAQLENALVNLALNARDAMPRGGNLTIETGNARIERSVMTLGEVIQSGSYVMLAVSDNGLGMAPDVIERAFEPFFTTKGVGKGSGLGLSMIYGFVKQSGGYVKIVSKPNQGTTVRLYLPRVQADSSVGDSDSLHVPESHRR